MYTDKEGSNVTESIEKGRTKKFSLEEKEQAKKYAARKRSYVYDLYLTTRRIKNQHCGYAVPD